MSKYKVLYKCLVCGVVMEHPYTEPKEIRDEYVGEIAAHLADSSFKVQPYVREEWPYSLIHYCFGDNRKVGAAIFAGLVRIDE